MSERAQPPHFHVAFDTNSLFVEAENKLIKAPLSELILERIKIGVPRISWHLLDIVRAERHYQMMLVAQKLEMQANRVGKLLGKDFGITKRGLEKGIDSVIDQEVKRHSLEVRHLDVSSVDWVSLIKQSTTRTPPFEEGKSEKGFRDAMVLETFAQLVADKSDSKAQTFVLLTNDKRLKDALTERMRGKENVSAVDDVPTLLSMLNAFASHISEQELEGLLERAHQLFYCEGDNDSLFYKWELEKNIRLHAGVPLLQPPPGRGVDTHVTASLSSVGPTTFVARKGQQMTFATYIEFFVIAVTGIGGALPTFGAEPFRSSANTTYSNLLTGGPYPGATGYHGPTGATGPIGATGATGAFYPGFSGYGATSPFATGLSGTSSATELFSGGDSIYSNIGPSALGSTGSLYPGANLLVGATGASSEYHSQRGRKRFEIRWQVTLAGEELTDPRQVKTALYSAEWW